MSHPVRFFLLLLSAIATTSVTRGQISQDSRELPRPSEPPPLLPPPPEEQALQALSRYVFFPPTPPIFGGRLAESGGLLAINGFKINTPEQLADWVGEPFYPPLGMRMVRGSVDKPTAAHLASYRAKRDALLNELQNELALTAPAEPAARAQALRELARVQTPRIAALEAEAEQLDEELIRASWSSPSADWNAQRGWKLGGTSSTGVPPALASNAEYQVLRAAAFFQKGLLPEQRGLLREWAIELREQARRGRAPAAPGRDPLVIFFSPETARFTLPETLPADLRAKIGTYVHNKDELKRELRDAVVAQDKSSSSKRAAVLHELGEKQWPRFVALAELAESIRRDFAALPPSPPPALPPQLPPGLADQIAAYKNAQEAFRRERNERQRAALQEAAVALAPGASRETIADQLRANLDNRVFRLRQSDADFLAANAERLAALQSERRSIVTDLEGAAKSLTDPATGQPLTRDALMQLIDVSEQAFEKIGREDVIFRNYRIAMLEPGLSAEQRRLLFGGALVGLAQALPVGENLPGERFTPVW